MVMVPSPKIHVNSPSPIRHPVLSLGKIRATERYKRPWTSQQVT